MTPKIEFEEVFALSIGDRQSAVWRKILAHLNEKLANARAKNDGDLDEVTTAKVRGQIGILKALIALDKDIAVIE